MKPLLLRRLSSRLAFKQTVTFALLVMLLAWSAYALLERRIYGQVDEELQDRAISVRSMLQIRDGKVKWLNEEADTEVRDQFERSMRYYELLDEEGKTLDASRSIAALHMPANPPLSLESDRITWDSITSGNTHIRIMSVPVTGLAGRHYLMRIGTSLDDADEDCRRLRFVLLGLVPFIILAHAANAWIMAKSSLQPLEQTMAAAKQMTPFDLSTRLPITGRGDELDELNTSLNVMLAKTQSSFQRMTEFLRNLSHEIRQPLTVLRAETEQALRLGNNEANYRETLSKQLEHVELLARTVSDLMELAHSENEQIKLQREKEDLSELVQAAIDGMRIQAAERNIHVSGTVQQNIIGAFDAGQIWRLLLNLMDNAIKFNRPNGRIDVSLAVHNEQAIITVTDTGSGIAAEEQTLVFERGYRTPAARKASVPGTGLGLHFARTITEAHGGQIEVTSVPGEGSCFRVTLPIIPVSSPPENLAAPVHRDASIN
ncbi:MAG TPA: ATP-binding protein [Candidatus Angelobacter sp.]|nr:ATP-binding protein [Candidatus Angelobacter sp.]